MAKHFGKQPKQWFDNQETHDFIHALAKARGIEPIGGNRTSLNTSEFLKQLTARRISLASDLVKVINSDNGVLGCIKM